MRKGLGGARGGEAGFMIHTYRFEVFLIILIINYCIDVSVMYV